MISHILIVLAGLMGAAGIVLAAAGAHAKPGMGLESASQMLLFHAPAVIAVCAATGQGLLARSLALPGVVGLVLGAALFSGDLALRAYAGQRLFPMAAPAGGTILIGAWLIIALAAIVAATRS